MPHYFLYGPGSSVGIVTDYGLDGPGIESRWGEIFPPVQTGPGAHPAFCTMGTVSFPGVKYGRGVLLTTHPLLVPRSWKSRAITLPDLWVTTGPVTGTLYVYLHYFLFSPNIVRVMKSSRKNGGCMVHARGRLTGFCQGNLKERDHFECLVG